MADAPFRVLPRVTDLTEHFWRGGASGLLQLLRCSDCRAFVHPAAPVCGECWSKRLVVEAVSGRARVATFTVNYKEWVPGPDHPYVIAIVELEEDPRVRLMTNLVECEPDAVRIGMPVEVVFEQREDVHLPLFRPIRARAD